MYEYEVQKQSLANKLSLSNNWRSSAFEPMKIPYTDYCRGTWVLLADQWCTRLEGV